MQPEKHTSPDKLVFMGVIYGKITVPGPRDSRGP